MRRAGKGWTRRRETVRARTGWRFADLLDESWRRMSGPQAVLAVIVCAAVLAVGVSAAGELRASIAEAERLRAAGTTVMVAVVPEGEYITAAQCARLSRSDQVLAAGLVMGEAVRADARWAPAGVDVPVADMTLGAVQAWWPGAPADISLYVGMDLGATREMVRAPTITLAGEPHVVRTRLDQSVRPGVLQASLVRIVPAVGAGRECWFRIAPGVARADAESLSAAAISDTLSHAAPFAVEDDLAVNPEDGLRTAGARLLLWSALGGVVLVAALVGASLRQETGIYRATGTSSSELLLMHVIQSAIIVPTGAGIGASGALLWCALGGQPLPADGVWYVVQPMLLASMVMLAAVGPVLHAATSGAVVDRMKV